jgi:hypothetical protein
MTSRGITVPGWVIWMLPMVVGAISGAVTASYAYGERDATSKAFEQTVNIRLCRIEIALDVLIRTQHPIGYAKWESCR